MQHFYKETILSQVIEQSFNSIVVTEANLDFPEFIYVNRAFTEMSGYTIEDLKGKTPKILQGEKTNREVIKTLKETLLRDEFFQGETVNYRKDGSEYYVEWNISPIKDKNSKTIYYISIQRDVTEKILLQQQREEVFLNNSKLAYLGEMFENIIHQWKQPLTAINLAIQTLLLEETKLNRETKETLSFMENQLDFMSETVSSFRNFLHHSNRKEKFKLKKVVEFILFILKHQIKRNSILVSIEVDNSTELFANLSDTEVEMFFAQEQLNMERVELYTMRLDDGDVADEIRSLIDEGEDEGEEGVFLKLAYENSTDERTKKFGGFAGQFTRTQLSAEIEAAVFGASEGDVVGPLKTEKGFNIFKIASVFKPSLDDEELKKEIKTILFNRKISKLLSEAEVSSDIFED
jgi:PAS domain S-box-containing protein